MNLRDSRNKKVKKLHTPKKIYHEVNINQPADSVSSLEQLIKQILGKTMMSAAVLPWKIL